MLRKVVPLLLAAVPTTVSAEWKSATSNHYIVYTEGTEASARDIAQKLEKHLFVLKAVSAAKGADSPVKVRVFMVGDRSTVSDVLPFGGGDGLAGFYSATLDGAFAVMPRAEYKSIPGAARRRSTPISVCNRCFSTN